MKPPALSAALLLALTVSCTAQEKSKAKPIELEALKASVGVWDATIEIWQQGPNSPSIKMTGVETITAYGEHWLASDFVSKYMGQTMKVHSIVGYDLAQKKLVGTIIDNGPYAASMTGVYDPKSKTISWTTKAKDPTGKAMVQRTQLTHNSANQRVLVMMMPGAKADHAAKFMEIKFTKRE